jgi:hypothetical protein
MRPSFYDPLNFFEVRLIPLSDSSSIDQVLRGPLKITVTEILKVILVTSVVTPCIALDVIITAHGSKGTRGLRRRRSKKKRPCWVQKTGDCGSDPNEKPESNELGAFRPHHGCTFTIFLCHFMRERITRKEESRCGCPPAVVMASSEGRSVTSETTRVCPKRTSQGKTVPSLVLAS